MAKDGVERVPGGLGPAYEVAELPAPAPFNWKNALKIVGPGAIVLSMSIGSGEWLMGPQSVIKYGAPLLWIVTVGIITQTIFNMESIRYTLYSGEPIMVGLTRLWPGPKFWGPIWFVLSFLSVGPGWVLGSATAVGAMILTRIPGKEDKPLVMGVGIALMILVLFILFFGGKIESMLEKVSKALVVLIVASLLVLNIAFAPASLWWEILKGFFSFGWIPQAKSGGVDWFLLGGLAGFAGAGGILNMATTNWMRDKGFGMGSVVGYIPSAVGAREIHVANVGKVFKPTAENVKRFRDWWKYALTDQLILFTIGCFLGMYLCVTLAIGLIPVGTQISGWGVAAAQAEGLAKYLGSFGWYWLLFIGFWVLWGTQLSASDAFVRQMTDLIWINSSSARKWSGDDVRKIYYGILILFTIWLAYIYSKGMPLFLVAFTANIASVCFVVGGLQLLFMDKLMPKEIRGGIMSKILLVCLVLFYGAFAFIAIGTQFFGLKL